jgi:hypothetical protein
MYGNQPTRFEIGSQRGQIANIGRDQRNYYDLDASGLSVVTRATGAARTLIVVGVLLAFAGFGSFAYPIVRALSEGLGSTGTGRPDVSFTPWLPVGFGLMFAGIVIGNIGLLMIRSNRR